MFSVGLGLRLHLRSAGGATKWRSHFFACYGYGCFSSVALGLRLHLRSAGALRSGRATSSLLAATGAFLRSLSAYASSSARPGRSEAAKLLLRFLRLRVLFCGRSRLAPPAPLSRGRFEVVEPLLRLFVSYFRTFYMSWRRWKAIRLMRKRVPPMLVRATRFGKISLPPAERMLNPSVPQRTMEIRVSRSRNPVNSG